MLTVLKGQINKHQLKNKGVMALCGAGTIFTPFLCRVGARKLRLTAVM